MAKNSIPGSRNLGVGIADTTGEDQVVVRTGKKIGGKKTTGSSSRAKGSKKSTSPKFPSRSR